MREPKHRAMCGACGWPITEGEPAYRVVQAPPFGQPGAKVVAWLCGDCLDRTMPYSRPRIGRAS